MGEKFSAFMERFVPRFAGSSENEPQPRAGVGYTFFHLEGAELFRGFIGLGEHVDDAALNPINFGIGQPALPCGGRQLLIGADDSSLEKQAHHLDGISGQFGHFLRSFLQLGPSDHV